MNLDDHKHLILAEELGELVEATLRFQQILHKGLRFGFNAINPVKLTSAREDFITESRDVIVILEKIMMYNGFHDMIDPEKKVLKHQKVDRMIEAAKELGTIQDIPGPGSYHKQLLSSRDMNSKGEILTIEEYDLGREQGTYTFQDGYGFWANENFESVFDTTKSLRPEWATHVVWYKRSHVK